jgi:hypothetical protein
MCFGKRQGEKSKGQEIRYRKRRKCNKNRKNEENERLCEREEEYRYAQR